MTPPSQLAPSFQQSNFNTQTRPMEQDAISDYGSDFTPDEEELLYSLLQQKPDLSAQKEVLVLGGIEDHEGPSGAKIPRMLYQRRQSAGSASTPQQPTSHVAVEMADNSINPPNGVLPAVYPDTNAD